MFETWFLSRSCVCLLTTCCMARNLHTNRGRQKYAAKCLLLFDSLHPKSRISVNPPKWLIPGLSVSKTTMVRLRVFTSLGRVSLFQSPPGRWPRGKGQSKGLTFSEEKLSLEGSQFLKIVSGRSFPENRLPVKNVLHKNHSSDILKAPLLRKQTRKNIGKLKMLINLINNPPSYQFFSRVATSASQRATRVLELRYSGGLFSQNTLVGVAHRCGGSCRCQEMYHCWNWYGSDLQTLKDQTHWVLKKFHDLDLR